MGKLTIILYITVCSKPHIHQCITSYIKQLRLRISCWRSANNTIQSQILNSQQSRNIRLAFSIFARTSSYRVEWKALFSYNTFRQAGRVTKEVETNRVPRWSTSAGGWVTPFRYFAINHIDFSSIMIRL